MRYHRGLVIQESVIGLDVFGDYLGSLNDMHDIRYINTHGVRLFDRDKNVLHVLSLRNVEVWC